MRLRIVGNGRGEGKVRYPPISPRALKALDAYLQEVGISPIAGSDVIVDGENDGSLNAIFDNTLGVF